MDSLPASLVLHRDTVQQETVDPPVFREHLGELMIEDSIGCTVYGVMRH